MVHQPSRNLPQLEHIGNIYDRVRKAHDLASRLDAVDPPDRRRLQTRLESHTRSASKNIIRLQELNAGRLQSAPHRIDIGGRAAARSQFALHAPDRLKGDAGRLGEVRAVPPQQGASGPDLSCRHHEMALLMLFMVLLD